MTSNLIKIQSIQNHTLSSTSNLVDFHLVPGKFDLSESYININVSVPSPAGNITVTNLVRDDEDSYLRNISFIRHASLKSTTNGTYHSLRHVNILKTNIDPYINSRALEYSDELTNMLNSKLNKDLLMGSPFRIFYKEGTTYSRDVSHDFKISLQDIFDICKMKSYDTSILGDLEMHLELHLNDLSTERYLDKTDAFGYWFYENDGTHPNGQITNTTQNSLELNPARIYKQPLQESPFYVGQGLTVEYSIPDHTIVATAISVDVANTTTCTLDVANHNIVSGKTIRLTGTVGSATLDWTTINGNHVATVVDANTLQINFNTSTATAQPTTYPTVNLAEISVTTISVATDAVVTCPNHSFVVGNRVLIDDCGAGWSGVNGVHNVTAIVAGTSFTIDVDTTALAGDPGNNVIAGVIFTEVKQIMGIVNKVDKTQTLTVSAFTSQGGTSSMENVTVKGVDDPGTIKPVFNRCELVLRQQNASDEDTKDFDDNEGNTGTYVTYEIEEDTLDVTQLNKNYDLPAGCQNVYIMNMSDSTTLISDVDIASYRFSVDNVNMTNRRITGPYMSYKHNELKKVFDNSPYSYVNSRGTIMNNQILSGNQEQELSDNIEKISMLAEVIPFKNGPSMINVDITTDGVNKLNRMIIFKEVIKSL
jgi:hypothetical protein